MSKRLSLVLLLSVAAAAHVSGQTPPAALMRDAHVLLLGGATLQRSESENLTSTRLPHLALGFTAGAAEDGWGALALGMGGRGGEYDSALLGAAASRRIQRGEWWSLLAFGGYGVYAERGASGIERDSHGILFGVTARWRVGPLTLAGVYSHLTGSYDETDVPAPFRFHVPRLSLGVGF